MATSPGYVRMAASAARPLTDTAFDALRDAVVVFDTRLAHFPLVLADATARRCLLGEADGTSLIETSLFSLLGGTMDSLVNSAVAALQSGKPCIKQVLNWRFPRGEIPLLTELKVLSGAGRHCVMATFGEPTAESLNGPGAVSVLQHLPLDLLLLDRELTVTYANDGAGRTAGMSPATLLGYSALTLIPTSALPRDALMRALEGVPYHEEVVPVRMGGSPMRWFDVDVQPLRDRDGIVGLAVLCTEVTERRVHTRLPVGTERRRPAHMKPSRDVIAVAGMDGILRHVSGAILAVLGVTPEQRVGASLFELVHFDDAATLRMKFAELAAGDATSFTQQYRARHRDGSYRWLESSFTMAFDCPIDGVVLIARDITERKQAETRLTQREEVFRLASDAVNGVIFEWDLTRGIVHRSGGVHDLVGMDPRELEAEGAWSARVHPQDSAVYEEKLAEALRGRRGWTASYRIRNTRGRYRAVLERGLIQRSPDGTALRAIGCCVDVSDIKRLTDLLADSQRTANIGGWEYDYATREAQWTDEMYRIFETTPRDFVLTWDAMMAQLPPESRGRLRDALDTADLDTGVLDLELEIVTLQDRRIWVHLTGSVEKMDGRPFRAFGSLQHIQEKKLSQMALQKSADWLKLSMGMAHIHGWRWDRATDSLEFAVVDGQMVHLPRVFPGIKKLLASVHPKDRLQVRQAIDHAFERRTEVQEEFRLRSRDGRYRYYMAVASPVFDADDRPCGLMGITQDITARRESEARVRRSEELLRITTANTSDILVLVDTELRVRFINREVQGRRISDIVGQHVSTLVAAPIRDAIVAKLHAALAAGEDSTFDYQTGSGAESQYFESRARIVREEGITTGLSITVSDFTERKRLEQEILDVASNERHSIGRDLHDGLGQELTGVSLMLKGLAKRIERECPDAAEHVQEIIDTVHQSIETARGLARGLLPLNTDAGGLPAALQALAKRAHQVYGIQVECKAEIAPEVWLSETMAGHLYRIAQEALTNTARHGRATTVAINLTVSARKFQLRIADNGIGLDAAGRSRSGMGLKIMKYRASMIGAMLEIVPNQPRGAVVRVTGQRPVSASTLQNAQVI